ncbi:MAG: hypothetical protein ACREAY_03275 [Nitrososphaera sp.]|uniref:hypothetical protein n=1 Tax=Nitrososphaera sp. TaxID=1971748 RepID=UPI003D6DEB39
MAKTSALPVFLGLASGIALIALFSTMGTSALSNYPQHSLGTKDVLVSKLFEYFSREPDNAVRMKNEFYYNTSLFDGGLYGYGLIADHDSKNHGSMSISTYHDRIRVRDITIRWEHDGDPALRNAGDLMASGIADLTIPDWQMDDGQPNRNVEMLNWIHANTECSRHFTVKDDLSEQRKFYISACENHFVLLVSIEP